MVAAGMAAAAAAVSIFVVPAPAIGAPSGAAETTPEWERLGLMRVRDMTPFGLARLDFLPAHAVTASPGTFAIETTLTYQNTWVRSDNVADWLEQRGSHRTPLTPADVQAITDLPGEAYLVDGEYGLLDLTLHHRASAHVGLYVTIPYFFFDQGLLDSVIEDFHGQFGFSNAGREFVPHNRWQAIVDLSETRLIIDGAPRNDFGDPVFGLRYSLLAQPENWNLVLEAAVKLPRQREQTFIASGATDYGLQASYQHFFSRNALYLTASAVYFASPDPGLARDQWIPTIIAGWETRLTRRLGLVLQLYGSRSTVQNTTLDELSADKLQITAGVQWHHRGHVLRLGLTENLANFHNTPDVGLSFSVGRIFNNATR
jgi:hypothetical protein